MFNFLSTENQKTVVGFSLTPGIGLEAVVLDKTKTNVINYGRKKVEYNFSQRNIQDYTQFKSALSELIQEMHIPAKSYAYFVLPNVFFDFLDTRGQIADVETALISKAEEFYIFKKDEPVIGWCDVVHPSGGDARRIAYSAFQKSDVEEIKQTFSDVNLQLIGIESSYSATLKGLHLTGLISDAVIMNSSWTALVINTNSFTLFQMEGANLVDCNDVPLAIKSFSPEEAYQAIVSSVSQLLDMFASNQLYIISQTDDISAEALKKIMQYDRDIIALESNRYSKKPLIEVVSAIGDFNEANSLTLASIGAADSKSTFGLDMNVYGKDTSSSMGVYFTTNIGGKPVEISDTTVKSFSVVLTLACALVFGGAIGASMYFGGLKQSELNSLNSESQQLTQQIDELSKIEVAQPTEEIDMTDIIDSVANSNVSAINFYDSISSDIPKNIWLTKYYNKGGDRLVVRGVAESIVDIYEYYKNLRIVSPQSDIKLTELKVITNPNRANESMNDFFTHISMDKEVDRLYSFEISNTQVQLNLSEYTTRTSSKNGGYGGEKPSGIDETDLLKGPPSTNIEQPSDQMSPAN
ncbi:MAG: hypothetical protein IKL52_00600 [Candidatus Gastranaerophilales bacterium]|nr:hypothetical protein [Candidatus Gastranaerophilales bacterium]